MLSFDNLFVFHLVFAYYCTPEALLYRALYFGIAGAMLLRAFFLFVGYAFLVSGMYVFKLAFGALLIWSGIRSANDFDDEDTADPTNNRCIAWVAKNFPVSDSYEPHGRFFITVAEVDCPQASGDWADTEPGALQSELRMDSMEVATAANLPRLESFEGSSLLDPHRGSGPSHSAGLPREGWSRGVSDSFEVTRRAPRLRRKASLLFLVVVAVMLVDIAFAVDSVASKIASVNDVFLNCSSSAFAMLSLRSLYFVVESLTRTFQMLKYGVAAILILIGLKLIFAGVIPVSNEACFAAVLGILVASVASSYWVPQFRGSCDRINLGAIAPITEADDEDEDQELFDRKPEEADVDSPGAGDDGERVMAGRPQSFGGHGAL
mmetsp:Transcript_100262/g.269399  ORF Transcript_100262/g.269399 Transcript_100262/m.269399 type:complete len:378 (+) Transcript_100262:22-1155(+)